MKRIFCLAVFLASVTSLSSLYAQSEKEILATLNKANERLMRGDISALDDVKALPGDDSVNGLLLFFKQYFYVFSSETEKKAIAKKAALYMTTCPTAGPFIKRLFKKQEGRPKSGQLANFRQPALDALTDAGNGFAVRTLMELLDETELEVPPTDFSVALAKMSLPSAPFSRQLQKGSATPEGIAKWKEWWKTNQANYAN